MSSTLLETLRADRRGNRRIAGTVASALRLSNAKGRVQAWHYLRRCLVPAQIALRVLSTHGPRRNADARPDDKAFTLPGTNSAGAEQRSLQVAQDASAGFAPRRRINQVAAIICERALQRMHTDSREYAESLLRMYNLKTVTIMRVLYDPKLRRRQHSASAD
ncbi:hypothetical protein [Pseudoduganella rhizocola]|uniref:hypothetical protein n=1 Tax=Pseudoduganella rhizocola TaxID=3382643 RepID=UPI0038B4353E